MSIAALRTLLVVVAGAMPAAAGPIDFGGGHTAIEISAGPARRCAVLDDHTVRCWGFGGEGRLGYGNQNTIGDDETPDSAGAVGVGGREGDRGRPRTGSSPRVGEIRVPIIDDAQRTYRALRERRVDMVPLSFASPGRRDARHDDRDHPAAGPSYSVRSTPLTNPRRPPRR